MIRRILRKNSALLLVCLLAFLAGIPFGYIFFNETKDALSPMLSELKRMIDTDSSFDTAVKIFINNARVSVVLILIGSMIVPAILVMFMNGFLVGFVFRMLMNKDLGLDFFLKGVLPHGIIEIAAIFLSAAVGMRIGLSFITLNNKDRAWLVSRSIKDAVKAELFIVLPLLLIAAFIEAYISAALIGA